MTVPTNAVQANGVGAVSDDELNTFIQTCNNLSAARAFVGVTNMTIILLGFSTPGDGGAGTFYWNATSTAPDDGGETIIRPTGVTLGAWVRDGQAPGGVQNAILVEAGVTANERISAMGTVGLFPAATVSVPVVVQGQSINLRSTIAALLRGLGTVDPAVLGNAFAYYDIVRLSGFPGMPYTFGTIPWTANSPAQNETITVTLKQDVAVDILGAVFTNGPGGGSIIGDVRNNGTTVTGLGSVGIAAPGTTTITPVLIPSGSTVDVVFTAVSGTVDGALTLFGTVH